MRQANRLTLVSSAIVSALLTGTGCQQPKPTQQHGAAAKPMAHSKAVTMAPAPVPAPMPDTMPASIAATMPTSVPASMPTSMPMPVTLPTTLTADNTVPPPMHVMTTQASSQPASQPTTQAVTATSMPAIADEPLPTDEKIIESDDQLAERIAGIAEMEFAVKVTNSNAWPFIWKHQAALFQACNRLSPKAARFPRLESDAYAQLHDTKGEIDSLGAAIAAQQLHDTQPDEFVWDRDLDLHLEGYQTAPEKIKYLRCIIGSTTVPANVRAHAGYQLASVCILRGDEDSANAALKEALVNCPSSVECLKLRYKLLPATATRFERCTQLLDLLKANPMLSQYSAELADLVASSGLVQESLPWYYLAISTLHLHGNAATHSMLNYAAELYIADQMPEAFNIDKALLKIDPTNTQAHFLQVLITRKMTDKDAAADALQQAGNAMNNRIIEAMNAAAPKDAANRPTTRPINDPTPLSLPDLTAGAAQVNASSPAVKNQFAEALSDMAMLQGYFARQPEMATKLIDALKTVVPDSSPELARLTGWLDLLAKKPDEAKAQFVSVAEKDPLAELGMVQVMMGSPYPHDHQLAESMGRQLIQQNASGLLGAILWEPLHSDRVKLIPDQQAVAMQKPLGDYPKTLMSAVEQPQSLYSLHVEPVAVGSYTGEPLLAAVTIDNLTSNDLTIGPDGVLKPELLFKVEAQIGAKPPSFDAFDNIAGPTVLPSHSQFSQIVRIDQTQLLAFMNTQSDFAFQISGVLTTNEVVNRLGGYQVAFFKPFFREAAPPNDTNIKSFTDSAANGRPDQQITALSMLEKFIFQIRDMKNPPATAKQYIAMMADVIHRGRHDPLPAVAAWASKCEAELAGPNDYETVVRDMVEDPDWRHRQLAVMLLGGLDPKVRDELIAKLAMDPQGSVRQDATVMQGMVKLPAPATTRPTTEPATAPTTAPATLPDFNVPPPQ
jgi:tetratricopeptide (TPR) repeat protein